MSRSSHGGASGLSTRRRLPARRLLLWAHLGVGLATTPVLLAVGGSGALLALEGPVLDWALPRVATEAGARVLSLDEIETRVLAATPGALVAGLRLPDGAGKPVVVMLAGATVPEVYVDPATGRVVGAPGRADHFFQSVRGFHRRLSAGEIGAALVAWCTVGLLLLAVSGIVLWWPGRILRVHPGAAGWRRRIQWHQLTGAYAWLALLLLTSTGIMLHWEDSARSALGKATGIMPPTPISADAPACLGQPGLGADQLLAEARRAMPGARATMLTRASGAPVRVSFRYPEDRTPAGRSLLFLASCSGRVLQRIDTRAAPASYTVPRMWTRAVHTGDVFGWPTRVLAAVGSLMVPILALTGILVTVTRRLRQPPTRTGL